MTVIFVLRIIQIILRNLAVSETKGNDILPILNINQQISLDIWDK